jgi:hypothetical protein
MKYKFHATKFLCRKSFWIRPYLNAQQHAKSYLNVATEETWPVVSSCFRVLSNLMDKSAVNIDFVRPRYPFLCLLTQLHALGQCTMDLWHVPFSINSMPAFADEVSVQQVLQKSKVCFLHSPTRSPCSRSYRNPKSVFCIRRRGLRAAGPTEIQSLFSTSPLSSPLIFCSYDTLGYITRSGYCRERSWTLLLFQSLSLDLTLQRKLNRFEIKRKVGKDWSAGLPYWHSTARVTGAEQISQIHFRSAVRRLTATDQHEQVSLSQCVINKERTKVATAKDQAHLGDLLAVMSQNSSVGNLSDTAERPDFDAWK